MTRAKFKCVKSTKTEWCNIFELSPVVSGSPENEEFFKTTPAGTISLSVKNPDVYFEVGKEYYIDFTSAN